MQSISVFLDTAKFADFCWGNQACNFIKKEFLAQVFSCEFCEIFKNNFLTEHLRATASEH